MAAIPLRSRSGILESCYRCETIEPLKLLVQAEVDDKVVTVKFPERIRKQVVEDFKQYWNHVETIGRTAKEETQDNKGTTGSMYLSSAYD